MCKFCSFLSWYTTGNHYELQPGTTKDARISIRSVPLPEPEHTSLIFEFLVATLIRDALRDLEIGHYAALKIALELALLVQPKNSRVHDVLALYHLQIGAPEKALIIIRQSLLQNCASPSNLLIAKTVFDQVGKKDLADYTSNLISANFNNQILETDALNILLEIPPPSSVPPSFLPANLQSHILQILFENLEFSQIKKMAGVSKEWEKAVKSDVVKQIILRRYLGELSRNLGIGIERFAFEELRDVLKLWAKIEKHQKIRKNFHSCSKNVPKSTGQNLNIPLNFSKQGIRSVVQLLPVNFVMYYVLHNGLTMKINGVFQPKKCYMCVLDPIAINSSLGNKMFQTIPNEFCTQVRSEAYVMSIGSMEIQKLKSIHIYLLFLDLDPLPDGKIGQILIAQWKGFDLCLIDVLPGGIVQLLEYLYILDFRNLLAAIAMAGVVEEANKNTEKDKEYYTSQKNVISAPLQNLFAAVSHYKDQHKDLMCNDLKNLDIIQSKYLGKMERKEGKDKREKERLEGRKWKKF